MWLSDLIIGLFFKYKLLKSKLNEKNQRSMMGEDRLSGLY